MISSTSNQKVKQAAALAKKAKYRTETGLFVVEGPKMAAELPDDRIQQVYVTEHFLEEEKKKADHALYQKLKQLKCVETVTDEVLKAMSDTQTPSGNPGAGETVSLWIKGSVVPVWCSAFHCSGAFAGSGKPGDDSSGW